MSLPWGGHYEESAALRVCDLCWQSQWVNYPSQHLNLRTKICRASLTKDMNISRNKKRVRDQILLWKTLLLEKYMADQGTFKSDFLCMDSSSRNILTMDNLSRRRMIVIDWCCLCKKSEETINHLLLRCAVARALSWYSTSSRWMGNVPTGGGAHRGVVETNIRM